MDSYPYYMASLYCYIFILGPPPDKDNPYAPIDIKEIHKKYAIGFVYKRKQHISVVTFLKILNVDLFSVIRGCSMKCIC